MTEAVAADRLKSFIERIEREETRKQEIADDIKEIYAEAKSAGFDVKIMRQVVRLRKMEDQVRREQEEILDLYKGALHMDGHRLPQERPSRRAAEVQSFDADTGEITEQSPAVTEAVPATREAAEGVEPASRNQPDISTEGERSPAAGEYPAQNPGLGAGVEGMENGSRENPAGTMPEPNLGYATGRTVEDECDISAEGGSPSPIPMPDIPDFLRRTQPQGNA